jgi:hypothetical protein
MSPWESNCNSLTVYSSKPAAQVYMSLRKALPLAQFKGFLKNQTFYKFINTRMSALRSRSLCKVIILAPVNKFTSMTFYFLACLLFLLKTGNSR